VIRAGNATGIQITTTPEEVETMPSVNIDYYWVMKKMPSLGLNLLGFLAAEERALQAIMTNLEIAETTARFLTQTMIDMGLVYRQRSKNTITYYYGLKPSGIDLLCVHHTMEAFLE
jgi:hypothetical protein